MSFPLTLLSSLIHDKELPGVFVLCEKIEEELIPISEAVLSFVDQSFDYETGFRKYIFTFKCPLPEKVVVSEMKTSLCYLTEGEVVWSSKVAFDNYHPEMGSNKGYLSVKLPVFVSETQLMDAVLLNGALFNWVSIAKYPHYNFAKQIPIDQKNENNE